MKAFPEKYSHQWRIQNFLDGGRGAKVESGGAKLLLWTICFWKLHENENWTQMEPESPMPPPNAHITIVFL